LFIWYDLIVMIDNSINLFRLHWWLWLIKKWVIEVGKRSI